MSRRRLTPDETDLWRKVTETTEKLKRTPSVSHPKRPGRIEAPFKHVNAGTHEDAPAKTPTPKPGPWPSSAPHMDKKTFARMRRGKLKPEARLDLHGMTLDRAHSALSRFILSSAESGKRLVLVITGKSRDDSSYDPGRASRGVLRRQVPFWLMQPPLSQTVLQVSEAHISHGGSGALYVYLKRRR